MHSVLLTTGTRFASLKGETLNKIRYNIKHHTKALTLTHLVYLDKQVSHLNLFLSSEHNSFISITPITTRRHACTGHNCYQVSEGSGKGAIRYLKLN